MSTSSGRKGFCGRCRHANNEHTREKDAKCKKCQMVFEICQVGVHGDESSPGWRICFIPCSCGEKHYPDKAKGTLPLQPHEYWEKHPGYRPLEYPDEEENSAIFDSSQIKTYETGDFVPSPQQGEPGSAIETSYGHTRSISEDSIDPLTLVSTPQKRVHEHTTKTFYGHARSESEDSIDPLSRPETYHQYTIDSVANLAENLSNTHIEDSPPAANRSGMGPWSTWEWNETHGCNYRYRKNPAAEGGYDYDYERTTTVSASSSHEASGSRMGPWSTWEWNETHGCNYRYRENPAAEGGYDYDYDRTTTASASLSKHKGGNGKKGSRKGTRK